MNSRLSIIILSAAVNYSGSFREGDWVNFTNFRYITSAATDGNVVYFGTVGGVIRYDRTSQRWLDPLTITDGIPHERIDHIAYDPSNGRLWVGTPVGNAYYQPTFREWYGGGEFPYDLERNDYRADDFPVLTTEFGYNYLNGTIMDMTLQEFTLTRGVSDGFDKLYVGTWGMGPVLINARYRDLTMIPFGPYFSENSTVIRIDDNLWLGDDRLSGGALTKFDLKKGDWSWFQTRYTNGLASSRLTDGTNGKNCAWLGTEYGMVRYGYSDDDFSIFADFSSLPSTTVLSVAANTLGAYVGTDNGLGFIAADPVEKNENSPNPDSSDTPNNPGSGLPAKSLIGFRINSLKIISESLYLGTDKGVLRKNLSANRDFEYVNTPEGMLSTEIYNIEQMGDSLLFLTNRDIQIIDLKTEESSTLTDYRYFDRWRLRRLAADSENIWAASDMGLWKYRIKDGYSRLYTVADGMISDDIRGLVIDGDFIWLATPEGLIRFYWNDPARID